MLSKIAHKLYSEMKALLDINYESIVNERKEDEEAKHESATE